MTDDPSYEALIESAVGRKIAAIFGVPADDDPTTPSVIEIVFADGPPLKLTPGHLSLTAYPAMIFEDPSIDYLRVPFALGMEDSTVIDVSILHDPAGHIVEVKIETARRPLHVRFEKRHGLRLVTTT